MILNPDDEELLNQMKDVCDYFININKPKSFIPGDNAVINYEKGQQSILSSMEESGINTKSLTVFEFYSRIEHLENKYKSKHHGSNKQI